MAAARALKQKSIIGAILAVVAGIAAWSTQNYRGSGSTVPAASVPVQAGQGRLERISDGDTFTALVPKEDGAGQEVRKIRVLGINTPELHRKPGTSGPFTPDPFAQEAADRFAQLAPPGTDVRLEVYGRKAEDNFNRLLRVVVLPDGRDVGLLLLQEGLAKYYPITGEGTEELKQRYLDAELSAWEARKGIWSLPKNFEAGPSAKKKK